MSSPGKFLTLDTKLLAALSRILKGELGRRILRHKEVEASKGNAVRRRQVKQMRMFEQSFPTNEQGSPKFRMLRVSSSPAQCRLPGPWFRPGSCFGQASPGRQNKQAVLRLLPSTCRDELLRHLLREAARATAPAPALAWATPQSRLPAGWPQRQARATTRRAGEQQPSISMARGGGAIRAVRKLPPPPVPAPHLDRCVSCPCLAPNALCAGVVDALYAVVEGPPEPATRPRGDSRDRSPAGEAHSRSPSRRSSGRSPARRPAPSWRPWQGRRQWQKQRQGWQTGRQTLQHP